MEVQKDFRELLELFTTHNVEYMIVGGYALAFHGAPRYTGDLDIFIRPDAINARRILRALEEFGFESVGFTAADFEKPDTVIQLGVPPVRVDIITSLTGISWETAFANRVQGRYGNVPVQYIGREQFIRNKRSIGRLKDLADIEAIGGE
jgi:Aminoglycoside-2''-adenylyltransferase